MLQFNLCYRAPIMENQREDRVWSKSHKHKENWAFSKRCVDFPLTSVFTARLTLSLELNVISTTQRPLTVITSFSNVLIMIFTSKHIPKEQSLPLYRKSLTANSKTDYWLLFTKEGLTVPCDPRSSSPSSRLSSWAQLPLSDRPFPNARAQQAFLGQQRKVWLLPGEQCLLCTRRAARGQGAVIHCADPILALTRPWH